MQNRPKPNKTLTRLIADGGQRRFSTFDDLAQWAVDIGLADSVEQVRQERTNLWGNLVFQWYTQAQIACIFAVNLARDAEKAAWLTAVVSGSLNADAVTELVDTAADAKVEAIQLLFPGRGDAAQAAQILCALSSHPRWLCADVGTLPDEPHCATRQVGLRWISPSREYESWALGLADFEPMPFTRRFGGAPFVALVLRPTPPVAGRAPELTGDAGLPAAHLAHLDDGLGIDQETRDKWTVHTRTGKRALLNPEPLSRARAKVTFAFTPEDYEELMARATVRAAADCT